MTRHGPLAVVIDPAAIRVGRWFGVTFQRTLRIPDDETTYPLPPGLGNLPVYAVDNYRDSVPATWVEQGGAFIPLYQREAVWLGFEAPAWHPSAVQVGVGGVNAVSGAPFTAGLSADPQNYLVVPDQPWLDGVNVGNEQVRQFVAVPLGLGATIEAQLTGAERVGGIQLRVFEAKPGRFPDEAPPPRPASPGLRMAASMGMGAGGRVHQRVHPDRYGLDVWDLDSATTLNVHALNSEQYRATTGHPPPPSPVRASTYTELGLPWFELYDEGDGDLGASDSLRRVRSVDALVPPDEPDESVAIDPEQVWLLQRPDA